MLAKHASVAEEATALHSSSCAALKASGEQEEEVDDDDDKDGGNLYSWPEVTEWRGEEWVTETGKVFISSVFSQGEVAV